MEEKYVKEMTAAQFLSNPTGKGSATVARRDRIKADMIARYESLYRKSRKNFGVRIFEHQDKFYYVFKIPSEFYHSENLQYDVIIEFRPPTKKHQADTLNRYHIRFFSNSPNFTFTYAYIYNQDDMLIKWMKPRISNTALKQPPEVRNPREEYGFEKSVYFALLFLKNHPRLMNKRARNLTTNSKRTIISNSKTSNQKLKEYNEAKKKFDDKVRRKKKRVINRVAERVKGNRTRSTGGSIAKPKSVTSKLNSTRTNRSVRKVKKPRGPRRSTR